MLRVCAVLAVIRAYTSASPSHCDTDLRPPAKEGNAGETSSYPWLGVLRVHLYQGDVPRVALTGLVLVKQGYAIANADDVARIPKRVFKVDTKAMFIPVDGKPWFCGLVDYMTHPEYEFSTVNTIALLELDLGEEHHYPMKPICWPPFGSNVTGELYAVGFTDDNQLLEKSIYSLQHVEKNVCDKFYNRAGLTENNMAPTYTICGFAKQSTENCIWDNGLALVSNSSQIWTLIGFGIRGPGCAAPGRFIDMMQLFTWIETATNLEEVNYRKSAFNEGFRKTQRVSESDEQGITPDLTYMIQNYYPFDTVFTQNEYFSIERIDEKAINIKNISLPAEAGNCNSTTNALIYHEESELTTGQAASLSYRITMFDLYYLAYSCIKISITPQSCNPPDHASLYFAVSIDNKEGASFSEFGTTPDRILQKYPILPIALETDSTTDPSDWKPGPHLEVKFLEDEEYVIEQKNFNIYLKFLFKNKATLSVEILGPHKPAPPPTTTSTTTTEPTTARRMGQGVPVETTESSTAETTEAIELKPHMETITSRIAKNALVSAGEKLGNSSIESIGLQVIVVLLMYVY